MSNIDDKDLLISVAKRVLTRLASLPAISKYIDRQISPFEVETDGWGIQVAKIKRLYFCVYFDLSWQAPRRTLWAGVEAARADAFAPILEAAGHQTAPQYSIGDTRWLSEGLMGFKETVERPSDLAPVLEAYGDENYFGFYCFHATPERFIEEAASFLTLSIADLLKTMDPEDSRGLTKTERSAVTSARIGQGLYKNNLYLVENACRITGVTDPALLRASHIKAWSLCENAKERLDGNNGLLLTPTYDVMFDRYYLTFDPDGRPVVSPRISKAVIESLGMPDPAAMPVRPFSAKQEKYMAFHRDLFERQAHCSPRHSRASPLRQPRAHRP
ncbi:hypothetical protein MSC49_03290 [Methylosinus sp. C49]|uniref:HNH endonuclease n=1 Tax=Methylosinus sp. C49 TaxID=2699395 RepID=UPI00136794E3|nr:HNH endonuclease signature motif containing protein [Methylosinus sp. C49]BBU60394.1 hypothetical protein MSC49_03290 [Methylosinus sp. C49]